MFLFFFQNIEKPLCFASRRLGRRLLRHLSLSLTAVSTRLVLNNNKKKGIHKNGFPHLFSQFFV